MKIVIVDDNKVNIFVIEKVLKQAGYEDCVSLSSASELFDYLRLDSEPVITPDVDLILLDIMMPITDGIEACRKIRTYDHLKDIPIIFITALEDNKKLAEALDAGGLDYITKPINKTELIARIGVALRLKKERDWHIEQEKKLMNELDLAMQIQRSLLNPPVQDKNISIQVSHLPSNKLAGDLYYWHKFEDGSYGIILLDMMGHGISSSLVCMYISSVLRDSINKTRDPKLVMEELNRYMLLLSNKHNYPDYYFTAIYTIIDPANKTVEFVNAGHPSGYMLVDNEECVEMQRNSCAIGFFEEMRIETTKITYQDHVQLLLFTDGVYEINRKDEDQMLDKLKSIASNKWTSQIISPINFILSEEQTAQQNDDICIMMIQVQA
ncbi:sigma-B regulation protein RsbU (phosphoserine phosphatase) [Bacillus ectoiniformans]|uniref:SpoIIE family protein phosphatase n=1 Tax=Bacillus ectoiniformans TaxID=1494429 RepID=UPI00195BBA41|nr:fused response regulator/phosphatase [Bacillus ectoiniformans]MBM7648720.1 sigma-B regulation protein RsbU (phosphoserine phosphatase) [Bacillus ectoiniformans]